MVLLPGNSELKPRFVLVWVGGGGSGFLVCVVLVFFFLGGGGVWGFLFVCALFVLWVLLLFGLGFFGGLFLFFPHLLC